MPTNCSTPSISVRNEDGEPMEWATTDVVPGIFRESMPWRTFRWYFGQRHYSGSYWSSTEAAHVIYESRLELSRLLMADFDPAVLQIKAQPFVMTTIVDRKVRRHVPDFWLLTKDGPVVVEVKPRSSLNSPHVQFTFDWVSRVVDSIGWGFEIASEQPAPFLENVRFLAGFRRREWISEPALEELRSIDLDGLRFSDVNRHASGPEPLIRAGLLHMLWTHELNCDLSEVLSSETVLSRGVR